MILYLIRHGETDYNVEGRYQGMYGESTLTEQGKEQARALAPLLATLSFRHVYCSTSLRTRETLALALPLLAPQDVTFTDDLREVDVGILTNHLVADMQMEHPAFYAAQPNGVTDFSEMGGECPATLAVRARRILSEIESSGHTSLAVVSHGAFLTYLVAAATGLPPIHRRAPLSNCSISVLEIKDGVGYLRLWNYTADCLSKFASCTAP